MSIKERKSNFELLRIVGMLLIVFHHLSQSGLWFPENYEINTAFLIQKMTSLFFGQIGNWIFILLSGYFIANSNFSWKKLFKLWVHVFSISVIIGVILYITQIPTISFSNKNYMSLGYKAAAAPCNLRDLLKSFLPIYSGANWFIVAYMVFYLFTPFLNILLKNLDRKSHFKLSFLMFFFAIIVTVLPKQRIFVVNNLFNFTTGYFIANYIRLYSPKLFNNKLRNILIVIGWCCLYFISVFIVFNIRNFYPAFKNYEQFIYGLVLNFAVITSIIPALFLLSYFKLINIKQNKTINLLASTTFGIYLIHENLQLSKYIWHVIFKIDNFLDSPFLLPYMIFATVTVFLSCSILEIIRRNLIDRPLFKLIDKKWK